MVDGTNGRHTFTRLQIADLQHLQDETNVIIKPLNYSFLPTTS